MKLNVKAFAIASAFLWGGGIFTVGLANMIWNDYGQSFLELCSSVYPGYHATHTIGSVIAGTLYGAVDAFLAGLVLAWLYNLCTRCNSETGKC